MAIFGSRRGAADKLALPLMIFAFLAVGGFLYWLNVTAQPTEVAVVEEAPTRESGASAILSAEDFLADPAQYDGRIVEVNGARVASRLGTQAFWLEDPRSPFLVKMSPDLVEAGTEVLTEQSVVLVGTVHILTDSTLLVWDSLGAFTNPGDRTVAEFAIDSPFLEATLVEAQEMGGGSS